MKIKDLTLATHNAHKLKEFADYLRPLGITVHSEKEFVENLEIEETGQTYAENALIKARAVVPFSPFPVLADDSGIEIEALGVAFPGVYSARYLESLAEDALEADRIILQKMKDETNRKAAFRCALALVLPSGEEHLFEGTCEGEILPIISGERGFGYDPIFRSKEGDLEFGRCSEEAKSAVSHRGKAIRALLGFLKENGQ